MFLLLPTSCELKPLACHLILRYAQDDKGEQDPAIEAALRSRTKNSKPHHVSRFRTLLLVLVQRLIGVQAAVVGRADEHFAGLAFVLGVSGRDEAHLLHLLHETGRPVVADA